MLVLGSLLSHRALVLGSSPSYHASACVLTAALYAEAGQKRVIIVSKQNKKRKENLQWDNHVVRGVGNGR